MMVQFVVKNLKASLDELAWDNLTATQWKHLEFIQQLLQPFAHHTNITSAENSTTIAMVIPVLKELNLHFEEMCKTSGVAVVSRRMLIDLNQRFMFATNPDMPNFDPVYVATTLVNPAYRKILNDKQLEKAKEFILQLMHINRHAEETEQSSPGSQENDNEEINLPISNDDQDGQPPPAKRFKHLDRVSRLLDEEDDEQGHQENISTTILLEEQQLNQYIESRVSKDDKKSILLSFGRRKKMSFQIWL